MKVFLILCVIFFAWSVSFFLDCYWYGSGNYPVGKRGAGRHVRDDSPPFHGDTLDNIFWFLQVSDIHISIYSDPGRYEDLRLFIKQVVGTVKPAVVFVTGDITDAKGADQLSSTQESREWHIYRDILNQSHAHLKDIPWIDLRGNHDAFNVPWKYHREDMYRQYAMSSTKHSSTAFRWSHKTKFGNYSFVGVDACPSPGLKRPYNFFGVLHHEDLIVVEDIMAEARRDNGTIVLTHYPSSFITADYKRLRDIFSHSVAHLCGHLHSGGEYFNRLQMYARHADGHLEIELSDWKFARRYRLLAYDHDILSFTDTALHKWPLVLVTNPISTQFTLPGREPIGRIKHSTHIRILVFSLWPVADVLVSINAGPNQTALPSSGGKGPLYVLPWQPNDYTRGKHSLTVVARDLKGNEARVSEVFSLDGSQDPLDMLPGFFLLTDHRSLGRMLFFSFWLLLVTCLMTAWYGGGGFQYFQSMTSYPPVFYPFLFNLLYFAIGPWYVGEVLKGVYGLIFVHGVITETHYIPGSLTYIHGAVEILTFYLPLALYLSYLLQSKRSRRRWKSNSVFFAWMTFIALAIMYHMRGVRRVVRSYGWVSLVISPGYFWTLLLSGSLVYLAIRKGRQVK